MVFFLLPKGGRKKISDRATQRVERDGTLLKNRTYQYDDTYWLTGITEAAGAGGSIAYQYDANGNTTHKTDTTGGASQRTLFSYNSRNQLKQVATGTPGAEVGQGSHDYNYAGMRIRHLGSERGDIEYVYDGQSILDELHNNSTNLVAHYRYGDRLLSLNTQGADQFYHYASLGTTANLTNAQGEAQVAYRTDPFGEITQQQGESVNRQVFTGQEHDEKTGLIYFGARFYDPDTARFINQDTYLGESTTPPSLHRYLYAYANPTVYIDPDGHQVYKWVDENGVTHFTDGGRSNAGKVHGKVGDDPALVAEIEKRQKTREQEEAYTEYCKGVGCVDPDPDRTAQVSRNMQRDMARPNVTQEGSPSRIQSSCFVEELGREYCQKNRMWQALGESSDAGGQLLGAGLGFFYRNPVKLPYSGVLKTTAPDTNAALRASARSGEAGAVSNNVISAAKLKALEFDGVSASRVLPGDNGKIAVIGRDMKVVTSYAEQLKKQGYKVELFDGKVISREASDEFQRLKAVRQAEFVAGLKPSKYLTDNEVMQTRLFKENAVWAEKLKAKKYTVVDLGATKEASFSPFYNVETSTLWPH